MRAILLAAILLSISLGSNAGASAAGQVGQPLPAGAQLIRSLPLPGLPGEQVVVYKLGGTWIGVREGSGTRQDLIWKKVIPGQVRILRTPEPRGLFLAITKRQDGASVYAYVVDGSGVRSAIAGRPTGAAFGNAGVVSLRDGFRVRSRDEHHVGSIPYRLVTEYSLSGDTYLPRRTRRSPDLSPSAYPTPNAVFHTADGSTILLKLQVADTAALRELGLMYRRFLDPDSGMVFVWQQPTGDSFWMENTYIPLSVAFVGSDGRIQETQDMQALTCDLHTPAEPYSYAIEANLGFFAQNGIRAGDTVTFNLKGADAAWANGDGAGQIGQSCPRGIHVLYTPSPAATASLAIGDYIAGMATEEFALP